jgi:hypothetical protein
MNIKTGRTTVIDIFDATEIYLGDDSRCWNYNCYGKKGYFKTLTILNNENIKVEINLYSNDPVVKKAGNEDESYEFDVLPVEDV